MSTKLRAVGVGASDILSIAKDSESSRPLDACKGQILVLRRSRLRGNLERPHRTWICQTGIAVKQTSKALLGRSPCSQRAKFTFNLHEIYMPLANISWYGEKEP